jgi:hypothetical protein
MKVRVLFFCFIVTSTLFAQQKRALLIGINQYLPPKGYKSPMPSFRSSFKNLSGPVNDVRSFHSVLVSRFSFAGNNIDTLLNTAATRAAILNSFATLLNKCNKGDIAFIMYAGHGSRVINTLSNEPDKKDESIVPADTYIPGVHDIRDKELAVIFNQFVDKGVKLTVFFDCCHSGSLSRGPLDGTVSRFIPDAGYDAKDASAPIPPETRTDGSFLFISSAQNDEPAKEKPFENSTMYGGFSYSFIKAIEQQSVNASVQNLFTAARAILKSNALTQEPVIAGSAERLQETFLGIEKGQLQDKILVPVMGSEGNQIIVQGGFAIGIQVGSELSKITAADTIATFTVQKILGVNKALATITKGDFSKVTPGDLLTVTNWVYSQAPLIKIYLPTGNTTFEEVMKMSALGNEIRKEGKVKWISSLSKEDPYTTIFYEGNAMKVNSNGTLLSTPKQISVENIAKLIKPDSGFYYEVPSPSVLNEIIRKQIVANKKISIVNSMSEANYMLYGTVDAGGKPAYGLRKVQTAVKDEIESMPLSTKTFTLNSADKKDIAFVMDSIYDRCMKLSKIKGWLDLSPPIEGLAKFPYHLELVNRNSGAMFEKPVVKIGDKVDFYLVFDSLFDVSSMSRKFVYVFVIDIDGNMVLGYPRGVDGNQVNQFPKKDNKGQVVAREKIFGGTINAPAGIDNYFLLVTDEAIPNPSQLFTQTGVRSVNNNSNPLTNLLNMGNTGGTRNLNTTPSNWTLIKMQVRTLR